MVGILKIAIQKFSGRKNQQETKDLRKLTKCRYCSKEVLRDAIKCKHCGSIITPKAYSYMMETDVSFDHHSNKGKKYCPMTDEEKGRDYLLFRCERCYGGVCFQLKDIIADIDKAGKCPHCKCLLFIWPDGEKGAHLDSKKKCYYCSEEVLEDVTECNHCGSDIAPTVYLKITNSDKLSSNRKKSFRITDKELIKDYIFVRCDNCSELIGCQSKDAEKQGKCPRCRVPLMFWKLATNVRSVDDWKKQNPYIMEE